jgi:hypothetical protein
LDQCCPGVAPAEVRPSWPRHVNRMDEAPHTVRGFAGQAPVSA